MPAFDRRPLEFRHEGLENLGRGANVIFARDHRSLAGEGAVQLRQPEGFNGAFDEGILDDVYLRVDTSEARAQFLEVFDLHAGIVGNEQERRVLELCLDVGDDGGFFGSHGMGGLVLEEGGRVNADPGTHGGCKGDGFDKRTLGSGWPSLDDCLDDGAAVLHQGVLVKRKLSDRHRNVGVLIELEFHPSCLDFLDGPGGVIGDRAGFRIRHEAARTKNFPKFFYLETWRLVLRWRRRNQKSRWSPS